MNRIYKLKFDKRRNELVIVSEITAGAGKERSTGHIADLSALPPFRKLLGRLTPVALLTGLISGLLPAMVLAADLPTGGHIVGGQGSISTSGSQMTIHQQTQNMVTNWHSFDIGKNNTVQFVQPDSSSVALNRVTGASGSQIMGTLKANGQVFILNPNGVLFGKGARVNVGGLVASTKHLSTADFMKGQYTLSGSGNPGAQVVNQGSLTTSKGGYIVLAGERVSNSGTVTTPSGKTVLAAGKMVTLQLDESGLTSVSVNGSVVNALVDNRGLISATNGQVYLTAKGQDMLLNTVVNNSGTVEAKGLASRGGEIMLSGGDSGVVSQSGQLLADSQTGRGGKITLEGQNIHLAGGSLTSATGKTGGGEVYAGGGWQGKDSRIRNASKVVMDKTATVDVSATENGHGGTAVLWSDNYTNFRGTVLAKGGAQSGSGGQVETSSHRNLQASGTVDASARAGRGGEWLLDPTDVTIVGTGADTGIDSATTDGTDIFTPTSTGAQILNTSIESQLNTGTSVTVKTSGTDTVGQAGNITVNANITKSAGADAALTLAADGNITLDGKSITSTTGKLDVSLLAAGSDSGRIQVVNGARVGSNGGNITLNQLNHTAVADDGSRVNSTKALTLKVSGSTLDASSAAGGAGDIVIGVFNPNVNLCASAYTGTVRNAGALADLSGNTVLTGGNITLHAEQSGTNARHLPWYMNHTTVNASGDIQFTSVASDGTNAAKAEIRDTGNSLTAGGNILLSAELAGGAGSAIWLNGSAPGAIQITAGKNITLNGINPGSADALNIKNTTFIAGETLNLTGSAAGGAGVRVQNSTLNASQATITGTSTSGSTGFALTGITLSDGLADLTNVTLSSAGSAAGVVNTLDSSVVDDASRDNLLAKRIENMTSVDMGGKAIFDDSARTDKGWTGDYTLADLPNHGWIFNNTSVKAGGQVALTGVGFSNATMDITSGGLTITQSTPLQLTNTTINVCGGARLHSDGNLTLTGSTLNETSSGDEDVNLFAGQNMTLSGAVINAGAGKLNITLQAGENDSAMVYLKDRATLNSNGGNIVIRKGDDRDINPNAMAVKINNAVLNASATDATQPSGDILISTLNPNVNLSQPQYNNTVRNAGGALVLSGNASLTGRDLVLNATQEGGNAKNLPVFLNNATLTATRDITLKGTSLPVTTSTTAEDGTVTTNTTSPAAAAIELRGQGNVLTAGGNIAIENQASGGNNGIYLNGSATGKTQLTANGTITLNGSSVSGSGVQVTNAVLNASRADIIGSSSSGTGFSLTSSTLAGALTDLTNVSLSSAGSGAGAMNVLDSSVVTTANRDNLLAKNIENMTTVEMGGDAIFDDSAKTDKGWKHDYTSADTPNGGWVFNNTSVTAGGDVDLKGAAFTNATVTVSNGSLTLDNNGPAPLTGTTITVSDGAVSVHAGAGNIDLKNGNISAKGDINLTADNGSIDISGTSATAKANIASDEGNVTIRSAGDTALNLENATLNASRDINIDSTGYSTGVKIKGSELISNNGAITINAIASSNKGIDYSWFEAGVVLINDVLFRSKSGTAINAKHLSQKSSYSPPAPFAMNSANVTFDGGGSINTHGSYIGIVDEFDSTITSNGDLIINAVLDGLAKSGPTGADAATASGAIVFDNLYRPATLGIKANDGNVTINADASADRKYDFAAFAAAIPEATAASNYHNGFVFSGDGNISVTGRSVAGDAVNLRLFNNENLTGNLAITGTSEFGVGVNFDKYLSTKVSNATITGNSVSGVGVQMTAKNGSADLNGNSVSGSTVTGKGGVILSGSNVTITNGTLTGSATDGNGSGVSMVGGSNFVLDDANVSGHAVDGSGISVNGTLSVNNGTQVVGEATGSGDGVVISGNLTTDTGEGIILNGTASSGDGIKVAGDTALTKAILTGHTDSGNGVNIGGNLTADNATQIQGLASGQGTGVTLGASLTGAGVSGVSELGTGLQLADNAVVTDASLKGKSTGGSGVAVTGNISLDDTTAASLNAASDSGAGLSLGDGANVSIVNITTVTQNKQDADGNPVFDANGNPVTETVTTQAPVTTPVVLTGTSQKGSGVATAGNVSISGVILNGSATTAEGTGATLGGSLTIADNISGITVNATGNGTALVVDNATINADGYASAGEDFVISASTSDGGGTAIKTQGNNQLGDVTLNGTAGNGGTAVELGGQVSGADISGASDSGTAIRVSDGASIHESKVQGHSDSGTGLNVSGNATLSNAALSGTTETGAGAIISGMITSDEHSEVSGSASTDGGTGVRVSGTLVGGKLTGASTTTGDALHLTDGARVSGADIEANAYDGVAIRTEGQVSISGSQVSGHSVNGTDLEVSGTLSHDPDTEIDARSVVGRENIQEVKPVTPPPATEEGGDSQEHEVSLIRQAEVSSQRRGAVNAQVTQRSQPTKGGFHAAGTPSVPVDGYTPAAQPVGISLCSGNDCQSESLDAGKPAKGSVTSSGR
ncbi:filamentous hemagglutinin N-terminal domain-containing protein [Salmonella enterica]|nr:filamentous hemagglutinin N-terminal domain-containing protein [Salmonella enterica]